MESTNFIKAIFASFYSRSFYREVAEKWRARTFLYLLILLAICWVFISITRTVNFYNMLHEELTVISTQMPVMTVTDGVAKTQQQGTFYIKLPQSGKLLAVVNTDGSFKNFDKSEATVFISKDAVLIKSNSKIDTYKYPSMLKGTISPMQIQSHMSAMKYLGIPFTAIVLYLLGLFVAYIYRIVQSLVYALIGWLFTVILGRKLDYVQNLNIAMVAITPSIILCTLAYVLNVSFRFDWLAYFVLSMLYLLFGVTSQPSRNEMM